MDTFSSLNDVLFNYYFLIGAIFLGYLVYRILHSLFNVNNYLEIKYRVIGHTWRSIQCNKSIPYNIHCCVCEELMLPLVGLFCECCAVSTCKRCYRIVNKKYRCKSVSWPNGKPFYHLWVNVGNPHADNSDMDLKKYFCSWCQRSKILPQSALNETELCDFQRYKNLIIPPACVQIQKGDVVSVKPLPDDDWEPVIVFANRKSGSNRSDEVLSLFRGVLNPIQVIDIGEKTPESVMRWLPSRCRVLVAGGDGTVAWLLDTLHSAPHIQAPVAIVPTGTGNDLSRVLGWGAGCAHAIDAHKILLAVSRAQPHAIDRWKVTITPRRSRLGRLRPAVPRVVHAYNYASVGVDAQVALDFHHARKQFLYRFASRTLNYMAYAFLGAGRALDPGSGACASLERRLRVRVDARQDLQLPPLQALVLLNIPSWGAGVDLWSLGEEDTSTQSMDDGKLEVVGISSSFHIARLQCGLAEPYRFAQASKIEMELDCACAMQVDGEPWMQSPARIVVEPAGRALVLHAPALPF